MSDAAFREALNKYKWAVAVNCECPCEKHRAEESAFLARVLALYAARRGEEYEATDIHNRHGIRVRVIKVPPQEFGVGDRVRVVKEGTT